MNATTLHEGGQDGTRVYNAVGVRVGEPGIEASKETKVYDEGEERVLLDLTSSGNHKGADEAAEVLPHDPMAKRRLAQ